jgi:large subunit ribosomal protein L29
MLEATDLRELTTEELEARLAELKTARLKLSFRSATEAIENPMEFRALRRDIARVQTVLGEKAREG